MITRSQANASTQYYELNDAGKPQRISDGNSTSESLTNSSLFNNTAKVATVAAAALLILGCVYLMQNEVDSISPGFQSFINMKVDEAFA